MLPRATRMAASISVLVGFVMRKCGRRRKQFAFTNCRRSHGASASAVLEAPHAGPMTHARLLVQHCVPSPLANSFRCFPGGSGQRSGLARISFHRRFHFWLLPIPLIPLLQPCFWKDSRLDSFVTAHKNMGTFYLGCRVVNHRNPRESMIVPELPVDSGSEFTWIPSTLLE